MANSSNNFATERMTYLRTTELSETDKWAIETIEEHGCALIGVGRDCDDFGWTYSLGIYDTCSHPELITVGLPLDVAKSCLNEVARRMRCGMDVTKERQKELIGNVDCELRIVAPRWVRRLMNFSNWQDLFGRDDIVMTSLARPGRHRGDLSGRSRRACQRRPGH